MVTLSTQCCRFTAETISQDLGIERHWHVVKREKYGW